MPYTRLEFEQDLLTLAFNHYGLGELKLNPWDQNRIAYANPTDEQSRISLSRISKDTAWAVYSKVVNQGGDMYMGRLADTQRLQWVFGLDGPNDYNLTPGLPINVQKLQRWSVCINDCWILGAIHSQKRIILETDIKNPGGVYDAANGRYFVTGRELIGLEKFGYVAKRVSTGMTAFVCTHPGKAMGANLRDYARLMNAPQTNSDFGKAKAALFAQLTFHRH